MATFKAVIFPTLQAFEGKQTAAWSYYVAKCQDQNINIGITSKYANPWQGVDGKYLMPVIGFVEDFNWSPNQIEEIEIGDPNWFTQDEL